MLLVFWIIACVVVNLKLRISNSGQGNIFSKLARQSGSYYGMHSAPLGVAVFIIGVTLVSGYETEKDVRMEIGSKVTVGGYTFQFNGVSNAPGPNYKSVMGDITVFKGDQVYRTLNPEKRTYNASGMAMTEAAIDTGLFRDLYVAMGEPLENNAWVVRVYHKPFVDWIWFGCILMAFGGILSITDRRYRLKISKRDPVAVKNVEVDNLKPSTDASAPALVTTTNAITRTALTTESQEP